MKTELAYINFCTIDYLSILDQVLVTIYFDLQNITTIYKDNNIKYQQIYKHQGY